MQYIKNLIKARYVQQMPWWLVALFAAPVCAFICRLITNFILNQFYANGAMNDTYLYSVAIWRNNLALDIPYIYVSGTFFKLHLSWFLWVPNLFSYLYPGDRIHYLADTFSVLHISLGFMMAACIHALWPARNMAAMIIKMLAGAAFSLNPAAQSVLCMAHIEIGGPIFMLAFLWAMTLRRYTLATLMFILLLSVRQDMGLHAFGFICIILLLDWRKRVPKTIWLPWFYFAMAGLVFSIASIVIKPYFITDYGNIKWVYLGVPPYKHLTLELVTERLNFFLLQRSWIWIPMVLSIVWGAFARNEYIAAGYVAFIPWLVLSFLASSSAAGHISIHYTFPFLIAGAWPFLACSRGFIKGRPIEPASFQATPRSFLLLFLPVSFFLTQQLSAYSRETFGMISHDLVSLKSDVAYSKPLLEELADRLDSSKGELRRLKTDDAIKAVAPYALGDKDYKLDIRRYDYAQKNKRPRPEPLKNIDAILYFNSAKFANKPYMRDIRKANGLKYLYSIPGTRVRLLTNFDLDEGAPEFADLFMALSSPSTQNPKRPSMAPDSD